MQAKLKKEIFKGNNSIVCYLFDEEYNQWAISWVLNIDIVKIDVLYDKIKDLKRSGYDIIYQ